MPWSGHPYELIDFWRPDDGRNRTCFFVKNLLLQNQQAKINQTLYNYPLMKGIQVCSNKGPGSLQRGDNHKSVKMRWGHLKILFSSTTGPNLTRLGTNHPWSKRIQVSLKEGDSPSLREDDSKRVKIHRKVLKIFFSRTSWPKSIKLGTNYPLVKRIQVCSNKGPDPLQRGIITEITLL
jgi:hypothetical protein